MIEIRKLMSLIIAEDPAAADEVDALADRLKALAVSLRANARSPFVAVEGISDRVKMQVVGPDGIVYKETDTHRGNYEHP